METQQFEIYGNEAKAVPREKFIVIPAYLRKQYKSQINILTLHLKQLEKEEQKNPEVTRRKEIIKIRSEGLKLCESLEGLWDSLGVR